MKIRLTLEVGDELRRAIARDWPEAVATGDHLAIRASVIGWIADKIYRAENAAENWLEPDTVTREEEADAKMAVDYLRAAGWEQERIVRWIIAQRAFRLKLRKAVEAPVLQLHPRR